MTLSPVCGAESVTSLQDSLRPRWLPELNRTAAEADDDALKRPQTSTRPGHGGTAADSTADRRASVAPPSAEHRTSQGGAAASSNASRDEMTSPEVARDNDDDDRTLVEKTLSQLKPPQSAGNHLRRRGSVFASVDLSGECLSYRRREAFEKCWAHSLLRAASRPFTRCR